MADSLWMRLRKVDWKQYDEVSETPTSPSTSAKSIPRLLEQLASRKEARAMKASHALWVMFCRGDKPSPPASVTPTLPFLCEILQISSPGVQCEILDILNHLAEVQESNDQRPQTVRNALSKNKHIISRLCRNKDDMVADKATQLIEKL
ncbi:hypothetical protein HW115_01535 [Verrucomicrobiaceae bacterium N1E253]|uniref:Uncharacterized protein n=1 Tax=Oceaniferula marina TaxID=2748318 RepID=A0A851GG83_9BACT|nr:hypothetical protein [Oceaniferula marina]NWK54275.1 hypothetical protein [Oceaniferula marina]